jgi:RHS repeat-associated protein
MFGRDWWLSGLDQLVVQSNGVALVRGDGNMVFYWNDGSDGYRTEPGDPNFSTLVQNINGSFTITNKDQSKEDFDATGLMLSRTDRVGNVTTYTYDDEDGDSVEDELVSVMDPQFYRTRYEYTDGHVTNMINPASDYPYLPFDPPLSASPLFTTLSFTDGNLTTITQPTAGWHYVHYPITTFDYDSTTNLLTATTNALTNALPQTTYYGYDAYGTLETITCPDSTSTTFRSAEEKSLAVEVTSGYPALVNAAGVQGSFTDQLSHTTTCTVDRLGNFTTITNAGLETTAYSRDINGLVVEVRQPDPDDLEIGQPAPVTGFAYDAQGNLLTLTLPDQNQRHWTYDSTFNQVTSYTDENGKQTIYEIDANNGNILSVQQVMGEVDSVGNLETDDLVTHYTYTAHFNYVPVLSEENPSYDPPPMAGLLKTITDPMGHVTKYVYDDVGDSICMGGEAIEYVPPPDTEINPYAVRVNHGHLTDVYLDYQDDGLGHVTYEGHVNYVYDFSGNMIERYNWIDTDSGTKIYAHTSYRYDGLSRLTNIYYPDNGTPQEDRHSEYYPNYQMGASVHFDYDYLNRITQMKVVGYSYSDYAAEFDYTERGLLEKVDLPYSSSVFNYGYDDAGRLTSFTEPSLFTNGLPDELATAATAFAYDSAGRLLAVTRPDPQGYATSDIVTALQYDHLGRVKQVTDPMGFTTDYEYDNYGLQITRLDPDPDLSGPQTAPKTITNYNWQGLVTSVIAPKGNLVGNDPDDYITSYDYDDAYRLATITQPDPAGGANHPTTHYYYDNNGNLRFVTDPMSHVTEYRYDNLNRLSASIQPDPDTGSIDAPSGEANPSPLITSYTYYPSGRLETVTDALSQTTAYTYDSMNRLLTTTAPDPDGSGGVDALTTTYAYNPSGTLYGISTPSIDYVWFYDSQYRLTSEMRGSVESKTYDYDNGGNLSQISDSSYRSTNFAYDNLHRLTGETWKNDLNNATVNTVSYEYDDDSRLIHAEDSAAAYDYVYDNLGRVQSSVAQIAGLTPEVTLGQAFDANSNRTQLLTKLDLTNDFVNDYQYDYLNRMTQVTQQGNGGDAVALKRATFSYNALGQMTDIGRYQSTDASAVVAGTHYGYDLANRLKDIAHSKPGQVSITYGLDYDGNRLSDLSYLDPRRSITETTSFAYDNAGQLTDADSDYQGDEAHAYDETGNRTDGSSYSYADQMIHDAEGNSYNYDSSGNRQMKTSSAGHDRIVYDWDHRNRLTKVTYETSADGSFYDDVVVLKTVEYAYDVFDRMVSKTVKDGEETVTDHEAFVYDGENRIMTFKSNSGGDLDAENLSTRYLHGPAIDQVLAEERVHYQTDHFVTDDVLWMLSDQAGSVRDVAVYNSGTGQTSVVDHLTYGAFGNQTENAHHNAAYDPTFSFTGREYDADADLYYYRARWYDAQNGRFLSQDPAGLAAGDVNLYRYCHNDPVNFRDPSGKDGENVNWENVNWGTTDACAYGGSLGDGRGPGAPDWFDHLSDFGAGWGDTLSFGLTHGFRALAGYDNYVNHNSGWYHGGQAVGVAHSIALGGAAGFSRAGMRGAGREFSHWIPNRWGGPRSLWNGNYVSPTFHYFTDPFRYPAGWQALGPRPLSGLGQQLGRIPWVYVGGVLGGLYGGASVGINQELSISLNSPRTCENDSSETGGPGEPNRQAVH